MAQIEHTVQRWNKTKKGDTVTLKRVEEKLLIDVKVLEEKTEWGRKQYLITPLKGSGEIWVRNLLT